jgi:hypothetical protein
VHHHWQEQALCRLLLMLLMGSILLACMSACRLRVQATWLPCRLSYSAGADPAQLLLLLQPQLTQTAGS